MSKTKIAGQARGEWKPPKPKKPKWRVVTIRNYYGEWVNLKYDGRIVMYSMTCYRNVWPPKWAVELAKALGVKVTEAKKCQ